MCARLSFFKPSGESVCFRCSSSDHPVEPNGRGSPALLAFQLNTELPPLLFCCVFFPEKLKSQLHNPTIGKLGI